MPWRLAICAASIASSVREIDSAVAGPTCTCASITPAILRPRYSAAPGWPKAIREHQHTQRQRPPTFHAAPPRQKLLPGVCMRPNVPPIICRSGGPFICVLRSTSSGMITRRRRGIRRGSPRVRDEATDLCMCCCHSGARGHGDLGPVRLSDGHDDLRPDRAWNGYTVLSPLATPAVIVIDMNGNVVKRWEGYNNSAGGPARVLSGRHRRGRQRRAPAAPGITGTDPARLRRQGRLAVLHERADQDARGQHDLVGAPAPRLAARESSRPATTRPRARRPSKAATR